VKRKDAIQFHTEEASAARKIAAQAPGTPGASQLRANVRDHENLAEAARLYDYPEDLED
jgi:hypothetical protein